MTSTRMQRGPRIVRFGEFELDVRAGELRRNGAPIRIQEQPFRLLAMLLEHPGEVVLREEIRKRLWPNDTAVEVGHGINAAVLRLREALGDSAENPIYIDTVARRGYRFRGEMFRQSAVASEDLTGARVAHYRVLEKLGSGGMGVVYRGEDEKLGRPVALKFMPPELASEPDAIGRFHREARAASALNHPNICTVYAVEEHNRRPVIVMEFLEGPTLEALLARERIPYDRAISVAIQLAAALEAAHARGIVHRDLKPANIMLTAYGVKVLDFGLARMPRAAAGPDVTQEGAVLGTPNYMSPEQEQGREAGPASDIYSFGLVLREMAGASVQAIFSRCLARDPAARWESAAALKLALQAVAKPRMEIPLPRLNALWTRRGFIGAGCVALAALGIAGWNARRESVTSQEAIRFTIPLPAAGPARFSLSPDGRRVAFISANRLFVRSLDAPAATQVYAGEAAGSPFWAPDGRSIAFAGGGKLRTVNLSNGAARVLCDVNTNVAGAWGNDGTILIGLVGDGLFRIPAGGGALTRVTALDTARGETRHLLPQFLPGGHRFLFLAASDRKGGTMLAAGSLDSAERRLVMQVEGTTIFVPSRGESPQGHLLSGTGSMLMAQGFDSETLQAHGQPISVADSVSTNAAIGAAARIFFFSAAGSSLAYQAAMPGGASSVAVVQNWMAGLKP